MQKWYRRLVVILALTAFTGATASCYGSFGLTKKLYKWNGSLGNKFVVSIVFWILLIVPVYELLATADFLVLNVIEFWTGKSLISQGETKVIEKDGVRAEISSPRPGVLVVKTQGITIEANEEGATITNEQGAVISSITPNEDGSATIVSGGKSQTISPSQLSTAGDAAEKTLSGEVAQQQLLETMRGVVQ